MLKVSIVNAALISILLIVSTNLHAQSKKQKEPMGIRYLHVMLGTLDTSQSWEITDDAGDKTTADRGQLLYGGGFGQLSNTVGVFQYGVESGGLVSFKNDTSSFVKSDSNGLTARVNVKNQLFIVDLSIGGFVSVRPWRWARIYASAGPSIMFGTIDIGDDDINVEPQPLPAPQSSEDVGISPSGRATDVDVGIYGRAGIDIILDNGFIVGASARQVDSQMDFGRAGVVSFDGIQYFITLGQSF